MNFKKQEFSKFLKLLKIYIIQYDAYKIYIKEKKIYIKGNIQYIIRTQIREKKIYICIKDTHTRKKRRKKDIYNIKKKKEDIYIIYI